MKTVSDADLSCYDPGKQGASRERGWTSVPVARSGCETHLSALRYRLLPVPTKRCGLAFLPTDIAIPVAIGVIRIPFGLPCCFVKICRLFQIGRLGECVNERRHAEPAATAFFKAGFSASYLGIMP